MSFKVENLFSVKDKVVVITGGGSGLGKAIAEGFAANGARIYIVGRRENLLERAAQEVGGDIRTIPGDVSTKEGCVKIAEAVKAQETHVDTLVNCAGISKFWRTYAKDPNDADQVENMLIHGVEEEDFVNTNKINVNGIYFMTTNFIPLLRKAQDPNVCVISSVSSLAHQRTMSPLTYAISKAAINHLAKLLAGRLHPMKIRVNTVCPGIFPSEMTGAATGKHQYAVGLPAEKAAMRTTAGRPGRPEEIAGPVISLSSPAGAYINNAFLTVDGGRVMSMSINDDIRMPEKTFTF
ncbi:short-chain dehydrogenase [Penicillium chermesinum]|uniref:Short-chain dehydrogenase n=1 Tax=Penicillium chermesinum TaxID=63820 RepID=A0A9W9THW7_9EURO|nr:short-chain dehydrogenase [Penicillium chermesinum]KAJ5223308.1 short-chain dehydrogenase [Penicillium chermesinum]KAJ6155852.1 short-chain dehydrogenase [Penicillium chermesinum]